MTTRKSLSIALSLSLTMPALAGAQDAAETKTAPAPPKLTQQQVDMIVKQLADVEKAIAAQRGGNLGTIIQKFRSASGSDAAALAFYEDCEKLNSDRRALTRDEKKNRDDQIKKQAEKNKDTKAATVKEDGDFGTAVRLQLHYLIMALEAKDTKDMEKMLPELSAYFQEVVANSEKLRGRAGAYLSTGLRAGGGGRRGGGGGGGNGNPFVQAYQLEHFLENPNWSMDPLDFADIYEKTIFPVYREKKKADLGAQWDARMNNEAGFRKGSTSEGEYALWQQGPLLDIKWEKLTDLFQNGDKPVNAMAEMLAMIRDNPSHPASTKWLEDFRKMVSSALPEGAAPLPGVPAPTAPAQ